MNISVFGIGYVGAVSCACLAEEGHSVAAVDINVDKVAALNRGRAPLHEPGLDELTRSNVAAGRLAATTDANQAVIDTELSLICVGTPSMANGNVDPADVVRVCENIGRALRAKRSFHVVAVRSTMLPGSTSDIVIPVLERSSGKRADVDFGVAYYPEFLREGSAIRDFREPSITVLGIGDEHSAALLRDLLPGERARVFVTDYATAETVKYANNSWHATKVVFANEIGNFCKSVGVDSHAVMEIVCADRKLNMSSAYLRPGFAFGGSCLPKDLRALSYAARSRELTLPMIEALAASNTKQVHRAFDMVRLAGNRRVGIIGLSFKPDTDDLRESAAVELAKLLYGSGYDIRIYDRNVVMSRLTGRNLSFIQSNLPHLDALLTDRLHDVLEFGDTVVATSGALDGESLPHLRSNQVFIDLVRLGESVRPRGGRYEGFCW